jgi:hypothetical protein
MDPCGPICGEAKKFLMHVNEWALPLRAQLNEGVGNERCAPDPHVTRAKTRALGLPKSFRFSKFC